MGQEGEKIMLFENKYGYEYMSSDAEDLPQYLTPREVMDLLCIGRNTFYKLVNSGELKAFRIGKQWRVATNCLGQIE